MKGTRYVALSSLAPANNLIVQDCGVNVAVIVVFEGKGFVLSA